MGPLEHFVASEVAAIIAESLGHAAGIVVHPASWVAWESTPGGLSSWTHARGWAREWDDPNASEGRAVIIWDPVSGEEVATIARRVLAADRFDTLIIGNVGFPFDVRAADRVDPSEPSDDVGVHPFTGDLVAHGARPELRWRDDVGPFTVAAAVADSLSGAPGWDGFEVPGGGGFRVLVRASAHPSIDQLRSTIIDRCAPVVADSAVRAALRNTTLEARDAGAEAARQRIGRLARQVDELSARLLEADHQRFGPGRSATTAATETADPAPSPALSIVHISFDMADQAVRSIRSALAPYQRGVEPGQIEVVAVDNGSPTPLVLPPDLADDESVRLVRLDVGEASLAEAIERGVAASTADRLAIMIDGAHLLSPRVVSWCLRAAATEPAAVVAFHRFFLGDRQQVDAFAAAEAGLDHGPLLDRIGWLDDGYRLFEAAVFVGDSGAGWFDELFETNFLSLTREMWDAMGGVDARFDDPAGGFLNLDLFHRSTMLPGGCYVTIMGEGTFHQAHGGTTTNTTRSDRAAKVDRYRLQYEHIRGAPYAAPARAPLVMGHLHPAAVGAASFSADFTAALAKSRAALLAHYQGQARGEIHGITAEDTAAEDVARGGAGADRVPGLIQPGLIRDVAQRVRGRLR